MRKIITEADAIYLAATMDHFGHIGIKNNTMFVKFKTAYLEKIEVIRAVLGIDQKPNGPFDNAGVSKKLQYELTLVGVQLAILENIVVGLMRTSKRHRFHELRESLNQLRTQLGMSGNFKIARVEDL